MAVFNPLQQLAGITSMAVAGLLASTVLRGMHVVIAGTAFGPVDTIFGFSALLIVTAGLAVIVPLRGADSQPAPGSGSRRSGPVTPGQASPAPGR